MSKMLERAAQCVRRGFEGDDDANMYGVARAALLAALDLTEAEAKQVVERCDIGFASLADVLYALKQIGLAGTDDAT